MTTSSEGVITIGSGFSKTIQWEYRGFIRHNLAGIFGDTGWHADGVSQQFRTAYQRERRNDAGQKVSLGWAFDNGGGPFVHDVRGLLMQDFVNKLDGEPHFGNDGQTALVRNASSGKVFLVKEGFWGAYKCLKGRDGKGMGGAEWLGAPMDEEYHDTVLGGNCSSESAAMSVKSVQRFERGCIWWKGPGDPKMHVHVGEKYDDGFEAESAAGCGVEVEKNPPDPSSCVDECRPGDRSCSSDGMSILTCGFPGPAPCYKWLTNRCADGLACVSGSCVTRTAEPTPVTPADQTNPADACVQSSSRCGSDPTQYEKCIRDYSDNRVGPTSWERFPCPVGTQCAGEGQCVTATVPPNGTGGVPSTTTGSGGAPPATATVTGSGGSSSVTTPPASGGASATSSAANPLWETADARSMRLDETADSLCLLVRPALLDFGTNAPTSVCMAGNLPGIGWAGSAMEEAGSGTLRKCWAKSQLAAGRPFAGCSGAALPYRFGLVECNGTRWATPGASWGALLWSGLDDGCRETSGGAIELGADGNAAVPAQPTATTPVTVSSHAVVCEALADGRLKVTVTGPFLGGALMADPTAPTAVVAGADGLGWDKVTNTFLPRAAWAGDGATYTLDLPTKVTSFNLYVADADDASRDSWMRLAPNPGSPWTAEGDCRIGDYIIERT